MSSNPAAHVPPPPPSNGLGVAGFVCSILGVLTCGVLALISLPLSFFALFKRPRGLAIAGFIISLFAFIPPAILGVVFGAVILIPVAAMLGMSSFENEIATYAASQEIYAYYQNHGVLPDQSMVDQITDAHRTFSSNHAPRFTATGPTTFELLLPGKDGAWGTADDFSKTFDVTQMQAPYSP